MQRADTRYRTWALALLALVAVRLVLKVTGQAGLKWDFINFHFTGARVWFGEFARLYEPAIVVAGEPVMQYVGFPLTAYLFAPLGPSDPTTALLAFKAACAACMVLGVLILWWEYRNRAEDGLSPPRRAFYFVLAVGLFEPFWFVFVIGGQATALGFLLMALFMRYYLAGRVTLAAAFLVAAVLLKPFLVLVLPLFLIGRQIRLVFPLSLGLTLVSVLSIALLGWPLHLAWGQVLAQESSRWLDHWWMNNAPVAFVSNLWNYVLFDAPRISVAKPPLLFAALQAIYRLGLVSLFGWLGWITGQAAISEPARRHRLLLLGTAFALCFPTIVWPHYTQFLLLPMALLFARFGQLSPAARRLLLVIALLSLHLELAVQFALGFAWPVPTTVLATLVDSLLASGATLLLPIFLWTYRAEVLLTESGAARVPV